MKKSIQAIFFLFLICSGMAKAMSEGQPQVLLEWHSDYLDNAVTPYSFPDRQTEMLMRKVMGYNESREITVLDVLNVSEFRLHDCSTEEALACISVLKYFPWLRTVEIVNCGLKTIPEALVETSVTSLWLNGNDLRDLSGLEKMKSLTYLELHANNFITDYSPLAGLENLRGLGISLFSTQDVSVLKACKNLKSLNLVGSFEREVDQCTWALQRYCVPLTDASFLDEMPALEKVGIWGFSEISEEAIEQIENSETDAQISIDIYDGEVRDLYSDLVNDVSSTDWVGEGALHGLDKEDVLAFYEQQRE